MAAEAHTAPFGQSQKELNLNCPLRPLSYFSPTIIGPEQTKKTRHGLVASFVFWFAY
jgi:hypothetical protein